MLFINVFDIYFIYGIDRSSDFEIACQLSMYQTFCSRLIVKSIAECWLSMKEKLFSVCPLHSPTNTISRWNKYTLGNGDIIVKDVNKNGEWQRCCLQLVQGQSKSSHQRLFANFSEMAWIFNLKFYTLYVFNYVSMPNKIWLTLTSTKLEFLAWPLSSFCAFKNVCTEDQWGVLLCVQLLDRKGYKMAHAETDSLLQILKQAQKMEELLKQIKPDSPLSVNDVMCISDLVW